MALWKFAAMAAAFVIATATPANATEPILATYTVTGAPGAYTYNFSVTNNNTGSAGIYFIGVAGLTQNITGTPAGGGWIQANIPPSFSNAPYGGSSTIYSNLWCTGNFTGCNNSSGINSGQTVSGFSVLDTGTSILSALSFFAYAFNGIDTNNDGHFYTDTNPGFELQASLVTGAVPEPATWALMLVGFGAMGVSLRRRRRSHALMQLS